MHQQLRHVRAVGLIRRSRCQDLNGPHQRLFREGRHQNSLARFYSLRHLLKKFNRGFPRKRLHEADRSAGLNAIDQHLREPINIGPSVGRVEPSYADHTGSLAVLCHRP